MTWENEFSSRKIRGLPCFPLRCAGVFPPGRILFSVMAVSLLALVFCFVLCGAAGADSPSAEADAIQERFLAHFQGQGYRVLRNGYGHPHLERNVEEDGGREQVPYVREVPRTRWVTVTDENGERVRTKTTKIVEVKGEYTRWLGGYSGQFSLDLEIAALPGAADLATHLSTTVFPEMQNNRRAMEEKSRSMGGVLNRPVQLQETRWAEGDGWAEGLRIHEDTQVFLESEEAFLYGSLNSLRQPAMTELALGASSVGGGLKLVFWTDRFLFRLRATVQHSGSGNLEWKADGGPRAMELVREAYQVIAGRELALALPDSLGSLPSLILEAAPSSLPADGRSRSTLTATFRGIDSEDLEGQELVFEILPEGGHVPGALSPEQVFLTGSDPVSAVFTAPDAEAFPALPEKATIRAACPKLGLEDRVSLTLERYEGLDVAVEHPVLPAHPDYGSALTFSFGAPGENRIGQNLEAVVRAASPHGRLLTPQQKLAGQEGSPELKLEAAPGVEHTLYYHYVGEPPADAALDELVTVEIPSMGYRQDVSLSVGIDLALVGAEPLWKGPLTAGVAVPFRVRVEDRFHPETNVKELFEAFEIAPDLHIRQKSFVPVAVSAGEGDLCSRLLHHVTGSVIPRGASVREVTAGAVLRGRGDDAGWYLAETSPGGNCLFPGIIPWDRGSYQFEIALEPRWKGDASGVSHTVVMAPLDVSESGAGDAMMDDFFIPTLKSWVGLTPAGSAFSTAWDVAGTIHEHREDPKEAALAGISALASSVARDLATGWAGDAVKARLLKEEFRVHVSKAMDIPLDQLDDETFREAMKAVEDRYWAGSTFDALFGYALDRTEGLLLPLSSPLRLVRPALAEGGDGLAQALTFGSAFLSGKGGVAVMVLGPGAGELHVRDGQARVLQDAPEQMFASGGELQRVYRSEGRLVVPVEGNAQTVLDVPAGMENLRLYVLRGDGHSFSRLEKVVTPLQVVLSDEGITTRPWELPDEGLSSDKGTVAPDRSESSKDVPASPEIAFVKVGLPGTDRELSSDVEPVSGDVRSALKGQKAEEERAGDEIFPVSPKVLPEPIQAAITGSRVNFRSGPTVSSKVLGKLDKGERVDVLKEWTPPSEGEGVLARSCEIDIGKETIRLPNGFGVRITAVDETAGTADVTFRHGDNWVSGTLARDAVSSTNGDPWFLVQRQDGTLGWAFGTYVETAPRKQERPGPEVRTLYDSARILLDGEQYGEALFVLDQVLELYPGHVDALFERGRCLAAMDRYEEAVESFWEIPFYAPGHPLYLAWTGYCWQAMGRCDKALLAYGAALRLHPDHDIIGPVSDHLVRCRESLGLSGDIPPDDDEVREFLFGRWDEHIAGDIWNGSTRGEGLWETW